MFINPKKRLIDIIDDRFHIIATATLLHPKHGGYKIPNTGSFFVRNSPEGRQFLQEWMAAGRTNHQSKGWGDQGSLVRCLFRFHSFCFASPVRLIAIHVHLSDGNDSENSSGTREQWHLQVGRASHLQLGDSMASRYRPDGAYARYVRSVVPLCLWFNDLTVLYIACAQHVLLVPAGRGPKMHLLGKWNNDNIFN